MRLHLKLTKAKELIDFNYQPLLTSCIHRWIGKDNIQHGKLSLHSFSWLNNISVKPNGILIKYGSYFTLNFYQDELTKTVLRNILNNPQLFAGSSVVDIFIQETPNFSTKEHFMLASPILIKRYKGDVVSHYEFADSNVDEYLTETLKNKARIAGISPNEIKVYFDRSYHSPKTKIISYKGVQNKTNICPVILEGTPEMIAFAWNVGLGNSTGIGFGALK